MSKHIHRWRETGKGHRVQCETCGACGTLNDGWQIAVDGAGAFPAFLKRDVREPYTRDQFKALLNWYPARRK